MATQTEWAMETMDMDRSEPVQNLAKYHHDLMVERDVAIVTNTLEHVLKLVAYHGYDSNGLERALEELKMQLPNAIRTEAARQWEDRG